MDGKMVIDLLYFWCDVAYPLVCVIRENCMEGFKACYTFLSFVILVCFQKSCGYEFQELFMGNVVMFQVYPACVEERQHEVQG